MQYRSTNSMKESPSWETSSCSAILHVTSLPRDPNIHNTVDKSPPLADGQTPAPTCRSAAPATNNIYMRCVSNALSRNQKECFRLPDNFIRRKGEIVLHIFSHQDLKCVTGAIKVEMKRNTTVGDSEGKKPVGTDGRMILNLILFFESENWIYLSNSQHLINDSFVESAVSVDLSDG